MFGLSAQVRTVRDALRHPSWRGFCPVCEAPARFIAYSDWLRDALLCSRCRSLPRERALMSVIDAVRPDWRKVAIHESSPGPGGLSAKLKRECPGYVASQYDLSIAFGAQHPYGHRSENLEAQTFADESFDLVVTQDVFEHLFHPEAAIREIARTLKPGGAYVMTVPILNKERPTERRASLVEGEVVHHAPPVHHGNPIDPNGSLVTVDWGYDIADALAEASGLAVTIEAFDDAKRGMTAEYMDVVICRKPVAGRPQES
jgi:SAM-dependent methyltransferase